MSENTKVAYVQCHVGVQIRNEVKNSLHGEKQRLDMELLAAGVLVHYDEGKMKIVPWTNIVFCDLVPEESQVEEARVKRAKAN